MTDMMKVIVAGGRDFNDYETLKVNLDFLFSQTNRTIEIVSGEANGADKLGEMYAAEKNLRVTTWPAQWDLYGKKAGYHRNMLMAKYATHLVAFWDKKSAGTGMMIRIALEHNLHTRIVYY